MDPVNESTNTDNESMPQSTELVQYNKKKRRSGRRSKQYFSTIKNHVYDNAHNNVFDNAYVTDYQPSSCVLNNHYICTCSSCMQSGSVNYYLAMQPYGYAAEISVEMWNCIQLNGYVSFETIQFYIAQLQCFLDNSFVAGMMDNMEQQQQQQQENSRLATKLSKCEARLAQLSRADNQQKTQQKTQSSECSTSLYREAIYIAFLHWKVACKSKRYNAVLTHRNKLRVEINRLQQAHVQTKQYVENLKQKYAQSQQRVEELEQTVHNLLQERLEQNDSDAEEGDHESDLNEDDMDASMSFNITHVGLWTFIVSFCLLLLAFSFM